MAKLSKKSKIWLKSDDSFQTNYKNMQQNIPIHFVLANMKKITTKQL
jgi:hypothetical protein